MSDREYFTVPEIISFLEKDNHEEFEEWGENGLSICTSDYIILFSSTEPDELHYAAKALKNLDEHIKRAKRWLRDFTVKHDQYYPDGLDAGFEIEGIFFGDYATTVPYRCPHSGFTITFRTVNYFPCLFTVKFHKYSIWPYAWPFAAEIEVE